MEAAADQHLEAQTERQVQPLIDPFGRRVTDLRVSITDRCNFRCTYCMPQEGMPWLERDQLLTYEEQARIVRVGVERFGFESVRITGGEPTVRAHLPRLIAMLAPLGIDIAMTTNGVKLPEMAHDLADAGLRRINVSLDSLRARGVPGAHPARRPRPGDRGHRRRARRRPRLR